MATVTVTICDMCTEEQTVSVDTVHFDQDGVDYESDLCAAHKQDWESLEAARRRFAERARSNGPQIVAPAPSSARSRARDTPERREENREIRAWATQQGIAIGDRGRISEDLRTRYRKWKWEQNHPVPEPPRPIGVPVSQLRPVPSPPRTQPGAPNREGRVPLDPASAMATHSESRPY